MRITWAMLVLVGLAGCTQYQPVAWNGHGSWAEAQAAANAQRKATAAKPGFVVASKPAPARRPVPAPASAPAGSVTVATAAVPPPAPVEAPIRVASIAPLAGGISSAALAPLPGIVPASLGDARRATPSEPPPLSGDGFLWPVHGQIVSAFGSKPNGARNDGINIGAPEGTPVLAAENGIVIYAGDELPGYGRMLLIAHADGFTTAYAHNSVLLVAEGDEVSRGQAIAKVGRSGGVASSQLHFELRDNKEPIDPVDHLDNARTRVASVG